MCTWMAWANEDPSKLLCKRACNFISDRHGTGLSREPLHGKSCLIACYSIQFPTDHCNDPVLLSSFFSWWLRHGSMDPSEGTFLKVNADWNSRPFGYAPFTMSRCSCCLCDPRASPLLLKRCRSELRTTRNLKPSFIADAQALQHDKGYTEGYRHFPLPAGMVFLVSGEAKHFVHRKLNSRLMPMWCDRLPSLRGSSNARLFRFELNPIKCFLFAFLFIN